jgi:hypothetical protein
MPDIQATWASSAAGKDLGYLLPNTSPILK